MISNVSLQRTMKHAILLRWGVFINEMHGIFPVRGMWQVFVYLNEDLNYCHCLDFFENLNMLICQCIIRCLFDFEFPVNWSQAIA